MGDKKSFREPRQRGFDDDYFPPSFPSPAPPRERRPQSPSSAPTGGAPVDATVKFFNAEKGFGFVATADGADAFLHIRPLEAAGFSAPPEGAKLKVRIGAGQKGPQVTEVIEVDISTAAPSPRRPMGDRPERRDSFVRDEGGEEVAGSVRWFDPEKGFGFIKPDVGEKDLFVHISALERSGLGNLAEGQRVIARVGQGKKGPEARSLRLA